MALLRCFLLINVEKNIFASSNEHLLLALQISAVFGVCSGFGFLGGSFVKYCL